MIDRVAYVVARFGAIVILLGTAAACGFIAGRVTGPDPAPFSCSANAAPTATRIGGQIIVTQVC